jgi:alpha-D-ribose 1-methylphosphonate 5-triphosphate synthase subunit PhnL
MTPVGPMSPAFDNDFQCLHVKNRNLVVDIANDNKKRGAEVILFTPQNTDNQVK